MTSLFVSEAENELVSEDRGGMALTQEGWGVGGNRPELHPALVPGGSGWKQAAFKQLERCQAKCIFCDVRIAWSEDGEVCKCACVRVCVRELWRGECTLHQLDFEALGASRATLRWWNSVAYRLIWCGQGSCLPKWDATDALRARPEFSET